MAIHQWYQKKGFCEGPLGNPMRDSNDARELETLIKQADSNGLVYERRFLITEDADTKSKGEGDQRHTVLLTASTNDPDRDAEVILPNGVDMRMFNKNKIMPWAHDTQNRPPIGKYLWAKPEGDRVKALGKFADRPETHPEAAEWFPDTIFSLYEQEVLKGFSIGYIPLDFRPPTDKEVEANPKMASARRVYTKIQLLEISPVPVPCNPYCLAEVVTKGYMTEAEIKALGFEYEDEDTKDWTWTSEDMLVIAPTVEVPRNPRLDLLKSMSRRTR